MLHTEWDYPKKQSEKLFIWILACSREGCDACCDAPVIWWGRNVAIGFLDKINFFIFYLCVFVFCGECGCICMISICVDENKLWLVWLNDGYPYEFRSAIMDYIAHICMIIICITPHISV